METLAYSGCIAESRVVASLAPGAEMMGWDLLGLGLPAAAGSTALDLRFPFRGRGLFGTAQAQLADQLVSLLAQIEQGRDAYARGVIEERLRIARDLHDDVGARLLSGLHRHDLSQTREAMRGAIGDLRSIVSGLSGRDLPLEAVLAVLQARRGGGFGERFGFGATPNGSAEASSSTLAGADSAPTSRATPSST
jgi:signal transduction histidine kinase